MALLQNPELFMPVGDLKAYYYRKLYTNNTGHAVLGYHGYQCGYSTLIQAIGDDAIRRELDNALNETAASQ